MFIIDFGIVCFYYYELWNIYVRISVEHVVKTSSKTSFGHDRSLFVMRSRERLVSSLERFSSPHVGYEPKRGVLSMEMPYSSSMGTASSGRKVSRRDVNPSWSDRKKSEVVLRSLRPTSLPLEGTRGRRLEDRESLGLRVHGQFGEDGCTTVGIGSGGEPWYPSPRRFLNGKCHGVGHASKFGAAA